MATIQPDTTNALNALLEDERASVAIEVAFASGATEYMEREALSTMGSEDLVVCCALRERLEQVGTLLTWRMSPSVPAVLTLERYDDRLRAFAHHQRQVGQRAEALLQAAPDQLDREFRRILSELRDAHIRHAIWCEERANEFAATRMLDFRAPGGRVPPRRPLTGAPDDARAPIEGDRSTGEPSTSAREPEAHERARGQKPHPLLHASEAPDQGAMRIPGEVGEDAPMLLPDTTGE
ncbi:MAG: hypothetical protein IVW57_01865 [Ktedonobacterales bacterium]|nr:hypothetical protein [Ktedonobacterales bacterium]